jgi:hypothetical protein
MRHFYSNSPAITGYLSNRRLSNGIDDIKTDFATTGSQFGIGG